MDLRYMRFDYCLLVPFWLTHNRSYFNYSYLLLGKKNLTEKEKEKIPIFAITALLVVYDIRSRLHTSNSIGFPFPVFYSEQKK
jgi:hypothetical protein